MSPRHSIELIYFALGLVIVGYACAPKVTSIQQTQAENRHLDSQTSVDSSIVAYIAPYESALDTVMNERLVYNESALQDKGRNSQIGFWICDILLDKGRDLFPKQRIDGAFYNSGGIRLGFIDTGWISKGTIYELAPFDNYLVLLEMKGKVLKQLCDHMAGRGGWPVSEGWTYTIFDDRSRFIELNGTELDSQKTYYILTNDYVANGGDDCDFLTPLAQESSGLFIRDIMIEFLREEIDTLNYSPKRRVELMMR